MKCYNEAWRPQMTEAAALSRGTNQYFTEEVTIGQGQTHAPLLENRELFFKY